LKHSGNVNLFSASTETATVYTGICWRAVYMWNWLKISSWVDDSCC